MHGDLVISKNTFLLYFVCHSGVKCLKTVLVHPEKVLDCQLNLILLKKEFKSNWPKTLSKVFVLFCNDCVSLK